MNLFYGEQDAQAWAKFSGDYNPIHFDLQHAQAMGLESLTVHGMRALLDMKSHLSHAVAPMNSDYYQFSARLRQAVKCQTPYRLISALNVAGSAASSQLTELDSGLCCFSGKLNGTLKRPDVDIPLKQTLTAEELAVLIAAYPSEKSETMSWEVLDAVLFERIVNIPETLDCVREAIPHLSAMSLADVFKLIPVVQTHHDVFFNHQHLITPAREAVGRPFRYGLLPVLIIGNAEQGFVIRMTIQGGYDAHPSIMTAITLKTWPVQTH